MCLVWPRFATAFPQLNYDKWYPNHRPRALLSPYGGFWYLYVSIFVFLTLITTGIWDSRPRCTQRWFCRPFSNTRWICPWRRTGWPSPSQEGEDNCSVSIATEYCARHLYAWCTILKTHFLPAHSRSFETHGRAHRGCKNRWRSGSSSCEFGYFNFYTNIYLYLYQVKIAVYASLISNVILCILQREVHLNHWNWTLNQNIVYAAITAGSLSLLATGIDAVFDIGSNVLLFWLHRKAPKLDVNKWPVGGARLETIGNIVYGMRNFPVPKYFWTLH